MRPERATREDIPELRALHLANWRAAYATFLPAAALGQPAETHMDEAWGPNAFTERRVFIVRHSKQIAAFVAFRQEAEGVFLENLHVAEPARGKGFGQRLMISAAKVAASQPIWMYVLEDNRPARLVYASWGGTESAPIQAPFLGMTVQERRVEWAPGHALIQSLRPVP